jgi:hypothetical protein
MRNKTAKKVLENFDIVKKELSDKLEKLQSSTSKQIEAANLSRTVDHQVSELNRLRGTISDQNIDQAAKSALKCFTNLSRVLRVCSVTGQADLQAANSSFNAGYEALGKVKALVYKKDGVHEKHPHRPAVTYKSKKQNKVKENQGAAIGG